MTNTAAIFILLVLTTPIVLAQTTDGMISGQVYDRSTGLRISEAQIRFVHFETGAETTTTSNTAGVYAQPRLSPGTYSVRVDRKGYQSLETTELRLFVAGRLDLDFPLRPLSDLYSEKQWFNGWAGGPGTRSAPVIHFYAADIETKRPEILPATGGESGAHQSAISYVIDARLLESMPLIGRDAYTALATIAGVTSDTTTARSLGLSVNGQRPSASNFLLDGLENNSFLLTGPTVTVAPEAISEYRISTNNFSAEYGSTSGFIANVASRSGSQAWHGMGYAYLKNDAMNANHFQRNAFGQPRVPLKELQTGFSVAGPFTKHLFAAVSLESLRFRSRLEERPLRLPNTLFVPRAGSVAETIMRGFAKLEPDIPTRRWTEQTFTPPSSLNRRLIMPRIDHLPGDSTHRFLYRVAVSRLNRPDFVWTPYPDFVMPLQHNVLSPAAAWIASLRSTLTVEVRGGAGIDRLSFDRPRPEIPLIQSFDRVTLPGSPTFYSFRNHSNHGQALGNIAWLRGSHLLKAGGGVLARTWSGYLTAGGDGILEFANVAAFGNDEPLNVWASVPRGNPTAPLDFDRNYRNRQFYGFIQDDVRLLPRLTVNLGLRYETTGVPVDVGETQDARIEVQPGGSIADQMRSAKWSNSSAAQPLYPADRNDWAARLGFALGLGGNSRTIVRGAYGIFYDRTFDNLWINLRKNNYVFDFVRPPSTALDYSRGLKLLIPKLGFDSITLDRFRLLLIQPDLRTPYVHSFFGGVRSSLHPSFALEVNALGSLGRNLITNDVINRVPRLNPDFNDVNYRANQGTSEYVALSAVADYRSHGRVLRVNYTLSRMLDTQSEPLEGDFFDLRYSQAGGAGAVGYSAFVKQFDSAAEYGPSDFDQRHNLTLLSVWDLPAWRGPGKAAMLSSDWKVAAMAAARSGFPFSVLATGPGKADTPALLRNRADLILPAAAAVQRTPDCLPPEPGVRGSGVCGVRLLNPAAFARPAAGTPGNTQRNQFRGPGLFSLDLSLSRKLPIPFAGEAARLLIRVDAYNVLNHVNLNGPASTQFGAEGFGLAAFGREGRATGSPALTPFIETPRQLQMLLRIEF